LKDFSGLTALLRNFFRSTGSSLRVYGVDTRPFFDGLWRRSIPGPIGQRRLLWIAASRWRAPRDDTRGARARRAVGRSQPSFRIHIAGAPQDGGSRPGRFVYALDRAKIGENETHVSLCETSGFAPQVVSY
jgi:hypothetical protein